MKSKINEICIAVRGNYDLPPKPNGKPYFISFSGVRDWSEPIGGVLQVDLSENGGAAIAVVTKRGNMKEVPYHKGKNAIRFLLADVLPGSVTFRRENGIGGSMELGKFLRTRDK